MTKAFEKAVKFTDSGLRISIYIEELNREFKKQIEAPFELCSCCTNDNHIIVNNEWLGEWEIAGSFYFNDKMQFSYDLYYYRELSKHTETAEERKLYETITEELKKLFEKRSECL